MREVKYVYTRSLIVSSYLPSSQTNTLLIKQNLSKYTYNFLHHKQILISKIMCTKMMQPEKSHLNITKL